MKTIDGGMHNLLLEPQLQKSVRQPLLLLWRDVWLGAFLKKSGSKTGHHGDPTVDCGAVITSAASLLKKKKTSRG